MIAALIEDGKGRLNGIVGFWAISSGFLLMPSAAEPPVVNLEVEDTYRAIFEAGLRPRRVWSMQESMLEIRPSKPIGFQVAGFSLPAIDAVWSFDIGNVGKVGIVRGVVYDKWSKEEALEVVGPLEEALGGQVEALEHWLAGFPHRDEGSQMYGRKVRSEGGNVTVGYYFRHTFNELEPLTLTVSIEFKAKRGERGFHRGILQPPPGFEHVDISSDPIYTTVPGEADEAVADDGESPVPDRGGSEGEAKELTDDGSRSDEGAAWWLWALGLLATAGLVFAMCRMGRGGTSASL